MIGKWLRYWKKKADEYAEMTKQQQEISIPVSDVREPIISFVNCVRENPLRFRLRLEDSASSFYYCTNFYRLTDKKIAHKFSGVETIKRRHGTWCEEKDNSRNYTVKGFDFKLTSEEESYICNNLKEICSSTDSMKRLNARRVRIIDNARIAEEKEEQLKRAKWMLIYGGVNE